jgi:hypothetical protein
MARLRKTAPALSSEPASYAGREDLVPPFNSNLRPRATPSVYLWKVQFSDTEILANPFQENLHRTKCVRFTARWDDHHGPDYLIFIEMKLCKALPNANQIVLLRERGVPRSLH